MELYDIDYSYSSAVIADLQSKGKKVMCYVSAGTSEDFRDDINLFPEDVKGGIVSFGEGDTVRAIATQSCASAAATAELCGRRSFELRLEGTLLTLYSASGAPIAIRPTRSLYSKAALSLRVGYVALCVSRI